MSGVEDMAGEEAERIFTSPHKPGIIKLPVTVWGGDQTMQMYG